MEEEKEKNRKVMVSRTPGGGMQRGRALAASNQCCDDANRAHDEHVHVRSDRTGVVTTGGPAHKPSHGRVGKVCGVQTELKQRNSSQTEW